ncbi:MAG: hypothetical protein AVDCRST_MAG17-285, partial [uncultured Solirubrobacterales bacterium]
EARPRRDNARARADGDRLRRAGRPRRARARPGPRGDPRARLRPEPGPRRDLLRHRRACRPRAGSRAGPARALGHDRLAQASDLAPRRPRRRRHPGSRIGPRTGRGPGRRRGTRATTARRDHRSSPGAPAARPRGPARRRHRSPLRRCRRARAGRSRRRRRGASAVDDDRLLGRPGARQPPGRGRHRLLERRGCRVAGARRRDAGVPRGRVRRPALPGARARDASRDLEARPRAHRRSGGSDSRGYGVGAARPPSRPRRNRAGLGRRPCPRARPVRRCPPGPVPAPAPGPERSRGLGRLRHAVRHPPLAPRRRPRVRPRAGERTL